jgi:hypothetical protein
MKWYKSKKVGVHREIIAVTSLDGRWAKNDRTNVDPGKLIPALNEYGNCE